jgi:hypothetical protein
MTNDPFGDALAIIRERGKEIDLLDKREIDSLIVEFPLERAADMQAILYEALSLIVNAPEYNGDIPPID